MSAERLLHVQREGLLRALCCGGVAEMLESVLDLLLAWDVLQWEEYQSVRPPERPLCHSARELLDLVGSKGEVACGLLLAALNQVLDKAQKASLSFGAGGGGGQGVPWPLPATACQMLQMERPRLVRRLRGRIAAILQSLVKSGDLTAYECDEVQLPIHTPSQQARRLLDLVQSKGDCAAKTLLRLLQQMENSSMSEDGETALPAEVLQYHKKLRSSVLAQSLFLSTYGGTGSLSLDDVYTEGLLEVAQGSGEVPRPLGLEDIFGQVGTLNEEADTVLLSGEAGSGKSTLLQRIHLVWARGEAFEDRLLLFAFSCRRLSSEEREASLRELLFLHCCWPDGDQELIFRYILDHPHHLLFTFDGLDEFRHSFSDERRLCCPTQPAPVSTLLFSLLQGSLMQGVCKVVTSRPQAMGTPLRLYIRKEVQLKGFSPEGISHFVQNHHRDPGVSAHVLDMLRNNSALFGLCHIPVLCWIVSKCYKELLGSRGDRPRTFTDVYLMILQHFFQHRCPQQRTLGSSWETSYADVALRLGRLALWGLKSARYVFSNMELLRCSMTEDDIGTGFLVHSEGSPGSDGKHYEFLHVTLQCFFAALFVVLDDNDSEHSAIPELFNIQKRQVLVSRGCLGPCLSSYCGQEGEPKGHTAKAEKTNLQITATFVSGLLSHRHRGLLLQSCPAAAINKRFREVARALSQGLKKHFRSIPRPVEGEKKSMHAMPEFVWLIKCIYETQDASMARAAVAKLRVEHLKLTYCNIGPVECSALAYVLQHLRSPVGLQLDYNSVGDVGVEQLLPCLHMCSSLHLRNNNVTDEGVRKLTEKVVQFENFLKIALFNNKLTDACMPYFAQLLKAKQNFIALRLGNNYITAVGAELLAEGLRGHRSLQFLGLVDNGVGSAGARALADLIRSSHTLEDLWLTKNCITREGVEYLLQALEVNSSLKSIWLGGNRLSPEDVEELKRRDNRLIF
uniref:Nucleotide-binding oligomerization domain containing 2 n=1 Tax=Scleropages formosus TaxID=113540 RepID=A0A8C9S964_SCLFO